MFDKKNSCRKTTTSNPTVFFFGLSEKIFKIFSDFENLKKYSTKIFSDFEILKKYSTENVFGIPKNEENFLTLILKLKKISPAAGYK